MIMLFKKKLVQNAQTCAKIGQKTENLACQYLEKQGFKLLLRNYRCKMGEIDLIMQDNHYLVFIEVRYRSVSRYGSSLESINYAKQIKLIRTAEFYLLTTRSHTRHARFDVVAVDQLAGRYQIHYVKNAIELR
jgi:putative endonuclease